MSLSLGAAKLPLRHLSIRVPWHDNGWNGTICKHPIGNASCLILPRIRESRRDEEEQANAGRTWEELPEAQLPPCLSERAGFMMDRPFTRVAEHDYSKRGKSSHAHFAPTPYRHPPYSAGAVPFRWMLREHARQRVEEHRIPGYHDDREVRADDLLGFKANWVQVKENQLSILDTFFSAVEPQKSLCFFYAKRTPLTDDMRRVIVGVGRIAGLGDPVEYRYSGEGEMRSLLWERDVLHTIRPDQKDGFLMPYHALLEAGTEDPSLDLAQFVAFAPDEAFNAFSYVSEHVDHDQAIAALLNCEEALRKASAHGSGCDTKIVWIHDRLNELWRMRGPCPGLGSALAAYGLKDGTFLAYELSKHLKENEDPWPVVESLFADPAQLGPEWQGRIDGVLAGLWPKLVPERRALLKLLSRFSITAAQASRFYQENQRKNAGIEISDTELLANPYLLYELDRVSEDAISARTVDLGVFSDDVVRLAHPLPPPSVVENAADPRRARALMVAALESAADAGHTVRDRDQTIAAVAGMNLQPPCPLSYDLLTLVEGEIGGTIKRVEMADGEPAYQLERFSTMDEVIRRQIETRQKGKRHAVSVHWPSLLDAALQGEAHPDDEAERSARTEKAAALEQLATARIAVLIGPAGTGKTTLLSVLCNLGEIKRGGVLLLAPTGKARVQLERRTKQPAQTIAQFLVKRGQYLWGTGAYVLSTRPPETAYRTVIIDEASMLTEEQLAATLSAFSGVERLILVGDPRQLPPIGAGRPFVDIVNRLKPPDIETSFPRVGPCYAELTIRRRVKGKERDDVLLAEWFSGQPLDPGADQIWGKVVHTQSDNASPVEESDTLRLIQWTTEQDLHDKLIDAIMQELGLAGRDDLQGFERAIGGSEFNGQIYFHPARNGNPGAAEQVERWQILSPVNGRAHGVKDLNRVIQRQFRRPIPKNRYWSTPDPIGDEEIVYGDKVINTSNHRRPDVYPPADALGYIANGEIGIVVGQYKGSKATYKGKPRKLEVEFSSQPGFKYGFWGSDFSGESTATLELAYAVTIHKAQGSEFGTTFLVLPHPLPMMSRELLYTALTRQQRRVVILHQGDLTELKRFDSVIHSETARRQTNLFAPPRIIEIDGTFLEASLIHRTSTGIAVRSKSEVIIADRLDAHGIPYAYEQPLPGFDDTVWYPDFTIDDAETGNKVFWEHLGLLHDPEYRSRWERKRAAYRAMGIISRDEAEGSVGTLVVTRDDERGGINAQEIDALIVEVFGR